MKIITKIFLLILPVVIFSCSKEDDPIPTSEGMVGEWSMTALSYKGSTTTKVSGFSAKADFTGTGKDIDFVTTFTADPNNVSSEGSYTIVLKTTIAGQSTTEEVPLDEVIMDGTWSLEGRTLTVTNGDLSQDATVTKQSDTTLQFKVDVTETEGDADISVTTVLHAVYTFEKI